MVRDWARAGGRWLLLLCLSYQGKKGRRLGACREVNCMFGVSVSWRGYIECFRIRWAFRN